MERPKETDFDFCYVDRKYNDAIEYMEALEKYADYLEGKINSSLAGVRLSLPSDAEIHSMADAQSLVQGTRDRMIHALGLEQGATWLRNLIREQMGNEA